MRFRAGNKLVYPHFTTFTEFELHPLFSPPPQIMNLSNSFLTVLKIFVGFFPCVSGLEISFYILVLSFIRNSNFNTYFRPKIIKLSNSLLNVLKMFGNFFCIPFRAGNKLVSPHFIVFKKLELQHLFPARDCETS